MSVTAHDAADDRPTSDPVAVAPEETYGIDPAVFHRRRSILAVMCISLVIIVMAVSSLNVAMPTIAEKLQASSTEMLWIIEAYALVFAGLLLPFGALGDRYGRKPTLIVGLVIFALASLVAGFSHGAGQLITARAVAGLGAALIMPATLSIVTAVFPPHERAKAIATWAGFAGAGGALGPLVSGMMLKWFGRDHWGWVFFNNLPLTIVMLLLVWKIVPHSKGGHTHSLDPVGSLLSIVALGSLVFGIIEAPHWGWLSPGVLGLLGVALVAGITFVAYERRQREPMLDPRLFALRGFSMGTLTITVAFFAMFGMYMLLAWFLQFAQGHSALDSAVRTLPAAGAMVLVAPRSPSIAKRLGMKWLIRIGFTLTSLGLAGMALLQRDSPYVHVLVALVVLAVGMAMTMAPTSATIVNSLPLAKAGVGSAVNDVSREVGGALGIAVMGSLLTQGYTAKMDGFLAPRRAEMPPAAYAAARDSIQAAFAIAEHSPPAMRAQAEAMRLAARDSFLHGLHLPLWVAAGLSFVAMLVVSSAIPDRLIEGERHAPGPSGD